MQNLADLIGLTIYGTDATPEIDRRRQLLQAISWYKKKGTYRSLELVMYLLSINLNIWDMYTADYANFVDEAWFVGQVGENPPGLGPSYYKSPHMGVEMILNRVFGTPSAPYLFAGTEFVDVIPYVERVRPVNVVPHYRISLNPVTDKTGIAYTVPGDIKTAAIGDWSVTKYNFDDVQSSSAGTEVFDNAIYFDYAAGFLTSLNVFKLGDGNKGVSPDISGFALAHVVMTGSVTSITEYDNRVEYLILLPDTTPSTPGISELGLYLPGGVTLKIASTFPDVNITLGLVTRILLILYKTP